MTNSNSVRIIGGKWRGRKLKFPDAKGLRPTQDRARETLFNWLTPWLPGAQCLDLFAGSGVLGFEALSRGAARLDLVEAQRSAVNALKASQQQLAADAARIHAQDALGWLKTNTRRFDLVFLDPPFNSDLAQPALSALLTGAHLHDDALVYMELPKAADIAGLSDAWTLHRDKTFGETRALLLLQKPC